MKSELVPAAEQWRAPAEDRRAIQDASREHWRFSKYEFLLAELAAANISVDLASTSKDAEKRNCYCELAWKAHQAVVHFSPTVALERDEKAHILTQLASLESKLQELDASMMASAMPADATVLAVQSGR